MRVNHLHLMVPDVPAASAFFEKYFALRRSGGNAGLTVLLDDSGFVLTLMKMAARSDVKAYPDNFHVGFFLESEARVDQLNQRMRDDGLDVAAPRRAHAYSYYVSAPGGVMVEVGA
jgi:catechol 2,3-dioxygenase-like lactoylglutathione lyase family enzyme